MTARTVLLNAWDSVAAVTTDRLPIVIATRKHLAERDRNAFELGIEAGRLGYRVADPSPHLHIVSEARS